MALTGTTLAESRFGELLDAVAARSAAPGGGSAAASAGALAAGLVEMAAKFTLGREEDAAPLAKRMAELLARARELRGQLLSLAERELHAYEPVLEALRLPADDPTRHARIRDARTDAADSPLRIARAAAAVAEVAAELAASGNPNLVGDALTAALLAEAACRAAAGLVRINLRGEGPENPLVKEASALAKHATEFGVQAVDASEGDKERQG